VTGKVELPSTRWLKQAKALCILMGDSPEARKAFYQECDTHERKAIRTILGEWDRGVRVMSMKSWSKPQVRWARAIAVVLSWRK
jgi:hypothetical protein